MMERFVWGGVLLLMSKLQDITLALAGILQASTLANELANTGQCSQHYFETSLDSIYKINSDSVSQIFSGAEGVKLGLIELQKFLAKDNANLNRDTLLYSSNLMLLERKLQKSKTILNLLSNKLVDLPEKVDSSSTHSPLVIANFANIYSDTIAKLSPRIMVNGKPEYLQQTDIIEQIRALLLAGIRAAVVWRQSGGNRWQLLLKRRTILAIIEQLV